MTTPTETLTIPVLPAADRAFAAAERLAPIPETRVDGVTPWTRHYAALALAAHAAFRETLPTLSPDPVPDSRPDLGYLMMIATSATAAAVALSWSPMWVAGELWDLTPEAGALNDEYIEWLASTLDRCGVNPADVYRWFDAADFSSPSENAKGAS